MLMSTSAAAEEHLRVIRSLMEKATVYRAISAPTALVGGCAGISASAVFHFRSQGVRDNAESENHFFLICWLSALALAAVANIYFLRADAQRRGEKFASSGMRAALRALWPSYLVAATLTLVLSAVPGILPIPWILLYGLGLLATQHFAPRSIVLLGWSFLIAGLLLLGEFVFWKPSLWLDADANTALSNGNLAMGVTFGCFHLIYAVCVWASRRGATEIENATSADV